MSRSAHRIALVALVVVALVLVACTSDGIASLPPASPTDGGLPTPTPVSTPSAAASTAPLPSLPFEPGLPYTADDILTAMLASTRPGGVPAEISTPQVAAAVAESLITIDGTPWAAYSVGGSCGPSTCSLEVVGVRDDAAGEDVWRFAVDPSTGAVEVSDRDLAATPAAVTSSLDHTARRLIELPASLFLASARWMPADGNLAFVLSYRSGNEEESCSVDIVLDAARSEIIETTSTDC